MNIYKYLWFLGDKPKDGKVTIQPSNKTIEVKNNQSILSAALDQGLDWPQNKTNIRLFSSFEQRGNQ